MKQTYIRVVNVAHSRGAKHLFDDVSFTVGTGEVYGLVGPNGSGKSTLMNIMMGTVEPDQGMIENRGSVLLVDQGFNTEESRRIGDYLNPDGTYEDRECDVALGKIGADLPLDKKLSTLSGGQQTKVRVAKQLLDQTDILLLDEPTNHLDEEGVNTLMNFVRRFHGPVVVVSHDRHFLNTVCTHIIDIRFGTVTEYAYKGRVVKDNDPDRSGPYARYIDQREALAQKQYDDRKRQETDRKKMELWLADLRQRASFYDSPRRGKLLRSRQKMFDRQFVDSKVAKPREEKTMGMNVGGGKHKHKKLLVITEGAVTVRGTHLYDIDEMTIYGQDRIVLHGANGSGKSTLLKWLKRTWKKRDEESINDADQRLVWGVGMTVGFFAQQDESLIVDQTVRDRTRKNFPESRSETVIRGKLADAAIPDEDLKKRMNQLSYGQRVKIRFLQLMAHSYALLIFDEPTNHLDIDTREQLEMMLQDYKGAVLLVSHDRWFVEACEVDTEWMIDDGVCVERSDYI